MNQKDCCPCCGLDGKVSRSLNQNDVVHLSRIKGYVVDHVKEQHNHIGGVIGYTLSLNDEDTEHLMQLIEGKI